MSSDERTGGVTGDVLAVLASMGEAELSDLDRLRDVLHPDFECWAGAAREPLDLEGYLAMIKETRAGFPDFTYEVPVPPVVDGDRAATTYRLVGTHTGEYHGMPPTGARIDVGGLSMFEVEGGRVRRMWTAVDSLALITQLRAAPS